MNVAQAVHALARPHGTPTHRRLQWGDFTAGDPTVNKISQVAFHRVPRRLVTSVMNRKGFRLRVRGKATYTAAGGAPELFDLTAAGADFTNGIAQPPAGTSVVAYVAGVETAPAAIDYANGTVSLATNNGDAVVIYALGVDGYLELRLSMPTGGQGLQNVPIYTATFEELNTIDQAGGLTAPRLELPGSETPLGPDWQLGIWAKAPYSIAWEANAKHEVALSARSIAVDPLDRNKLTLAMRAALGF